MPDCTECGHPLRTGQPACEACGHVHIAPSGGPTEPPRDAEPAKAPTITLVLDDTHAHEPEDLPDWPDAATTPGSARRPRSEPTLPPSRSRLQKGLPLVVAAVSVGVAALLLPNLRSTSTPAAAAGSSFDSPSRSASWPTRVTALASVVEP